ncbi:hypothetical protein G6F56_008887 [Rhizopus delemar]|nr:hypothetical protein G6F56_008887 [Rhizopus delemar]
MFFKDAENKDLFNYVTDIYNNIIKQLPRLPKFMNASKLDEIIKDKDLDERVSKRVEGKNIKGRMLYKLKDNTIGNLVKSTTMDMLENLQALKAWRHVKDSSRQ